jgi:hypothetical protein
VPHGNDLAVLVYVTDQDPDLDQVSDSEAATAATGHATAAAGGAGSEPQQQRQLTMQALPQQQLTSSSSSPSQQQQGGDAAQSSAAADNPEASGPDAAPGPSLPGPDTASGPSASGPSGPINIPQPVRRGPRAANAFVRSPSGPSYLRSSAAAAAVAAVPAAGSSAATGTDGSTGPSPSSTPGQGGEGSLAAAAGSGSSSPDVDKGRTAAAAAGSAAVVQRSPSKAARRPPLPSYSRTSSVASRGSIEGNAIAGEGWQSDASGPNHPLGSSPAASGCYTPNQKKKGRLLQVGGGRDLTIFSLHFTYMARVNRAPTEGANRLMGQNHSQHHIGCAPDWPLALCATHPTVYLGKVDTILHHRTVVK